MDTYIDQHDETELTTGQSIAVAYMGQMMTGERMGALAKEIDEVIRAAEAKTVPMAMLEVLDWGEHYNRDELIAIVAKYMPGYTVTDKEG